MMTSSWVARPWKTPLFIRVRRQLEIIGVDVGFLGEGDVRRLFVGALAEADANALREQIVDVLLAAKEIRLNDRADAAGVSGFAMDPRTKSRVR